MRKIDWLASYPKSGNTWVRCLIAAYLTGGINPNHLPAACTQSDLKDYYYQILSPVGLDQLEVETFMNLRSAVVEHMRVWPWGLVKTHNARLRYMDIPFIPCNQTNKAIYLVRDPREIVKSFACHTGKSVDDTIELMNRDGAILHKPSYVTLFHLLGTWSQHVDSWMKSPFPALCVKYETLLKRPKDQLQNILEFLGFDVDESCLNKAVEICQLDNLKEFEDKEGFREAKNGKFFGNGHDKLLEEQKQKIENDHYEVMKAMEYL